ncbi:hypothetical protein [Paenibacillus cremeus]|nr:hypothetical protein [Paenibacillus cremeus]
MSNKAKTKITKSKRTTEREQQSRRSPDLSAQKMQHDQVKQ